MYFTDTEILWIHDILTSLQQSYFATKGCHTWRILQTFHIQTSNKTYCIETGKNGNEDLQLMVAVSDIHEIHNFFFQNSSAALDKIKIKVAIACSFYVTQDQCKKLSKNNLEATKKVVFNNHNNHNFEYKWICTWYNDMYKNNN